MSILLFIHFGIIDIIDILLVAFILYEVYELIKGTAASKIFSAVVLIYFVSLFVEMLKMKLLSTIMGTIINVGVIALIVVFQQEIRKFLLMLGSRYTKENYLALFKNIKTEGNYTADSIAKICKAAVEMSDAKTGALIVISRGSSLKAFTEFGEIINSDINAQLIESLFYKNSPLHDGALLIQNNKIYAAKCILPVSENPELKEGLGLRHRSALGMSEVSDTITIVVSEQSGNISIAHDSKIFQIKNFDRLPKIITNYLSRKKLE